MSAEIKLKSNSGGSITLTADDALTTDEVVVIPKDMVRGLATAWVNFDGTATPPTIRDSYNVSNVTRTATGKFVVDFTVAMDNANYVVVGSASPDDSAAAVIVTHIIIGLPVVFV